MDYRFSASYTTLQFIKISVYVIRYALSPTSSRWRPCFYTYIHVACNTEATSSFYALSYTSACTEMRRFITCKRKKPTRMQLFWCRLATCKLQLWENVMAEWLNVENLWAASEEALWGRQCIGKHDQKKKQKKKTWLPFRRLLFKNPYSSLHSVL